MYKSAKFWDRVADKYAASPIRNPDAYEATLDRMRKLLSPTDTVLEIGCGTGTTALALAPSVHHITATDVSDAMLDKGREKAQAAGTTNVDFLQSDATDAPDRPFDAVLALNLLHLLEDLDGALAEIAKRTKPGGLFISKTFCMPGRGSLIWWIIQLGLPIAQAIGKAPYFAKLSPSELDAAVTKAGFSNIETKKAPGKDPRVTVIARRAD